MSLYNCSTSWARKPSVTSGAKFWVVLFLICREEVVLWQLLHQSLTTESPSMRPCSCLGGWTQTTHRSGSGCVDARPLSQGEFMLWLDVWFVCGLVFWICNCLLTVYHWLDQDSSCRILWCKYTHVAVPGRIEHYSIAYFNPVAVAVFKAL